ncbi:KAT8 regulatory NSL complex subunit 3-like [Brevipalpus obovatus]|uniref:KAT8 regulatory NSL complex subunit 3-like n=1 Tax=Brevipalpus obovatus TaxID=246614 RepID=UPI003D9E6735
MKSSPMNSASINTHNQAQSGSVLAYIHGLSGQAKKCSIVESEHSYSKSWNRHPDPSIKSRPAKFLFMESFLRSSAAINEDVIDVDSSVNDGQPTNPLVTEVNALTKGNSSHDDICSIDMIPSKSSWSPLVQRLWAKALSILYSDRLIRLSIEGSPNEVVIRKMLAAKCANRFRHLFASVTFWDSSILAWLNATLCEHISGHYLSAYHEAMQNLRQKLPSLIDKFYTPLSDSRNRTKGPMPDPLQNVLNNHKPKRIKSCPLFILVPNGPQAPSSLLPQRLKHWQLLFASLGKIVTLSINYQPNLKVKDCLNQIFSCVREKINECKSNFTEGRPIILVGFGHSSLVAAHSALDNSSKVTATICLGFPLTGVNGFRGDLDDPLLDTTVATLFIIGQNSTMSSIDDMEDFRERMTKAETGLVIVGGANDNLVVSQTKQRFEGITQSIVDRCIADEIYDFIRHVLDPHYQPSDNNDSPTSLRHSISVNRGSNCSNTSTNGKINLVKAKSRPRKRPPPKRLETLGKSEPAGASTPTIHESVEPPLPPPSLPPPPSTPKETKKRKESASSITSGSDSPASTPKRRKELRDSKDEKDKLKEKDREEEVREKEKEKEREKEKEKEKEKDQGKDRDKEREKRRIVKKEDKDEEKEKKRVKREEKENKRDDSSTSTSSIDKIDKTLDDVISGVLSGDTPSLTTNGDTNPHDSSEQISTPPCNADKVIEKSEKCEKDKSNTSTPAHLGRHYDFSYDVSEVATFTSSATRTRQIRAPKQLDM